MLQQATIQKKRSIRSRIATLVERHIDQSRLGENDGVNDRLLDLAGEEQCYRTVMVLIIGIMMDEFMQSWTDDQDRSPLEHRSQKQETICVPTEATEFSRAPGCSAFGFRSMKRLNDSLAEGA